MASNTVKIKVDISEVTALCHVKCMNLICKFIMEDSFLCNLKNIEISSTGFCKSFVDTR